MSASESVRGVSETFTTCPNSSTRTPTRMPARRRARWGRGRCGRRRRLRRRSRGHNGSRRQEGCPPRRCRAACLRRTPRAADLQLLPRPPLDQCRRTRPRRGQSSPHRLRTTSRTRRRGRRRRPTPRRRRWRICPTCRFPSSRRRADSARRSRRQAGAPNARCKTLSPSVP